MLLRIFPLSSQIENSAFKFQTVPFLLSHEKWTNSQEHPFVVPLIPMVLYLATVLILPNSSGLFEPKDHLHHNSNISIDLLEAIFGSALKIDADFSTCI